jgi:hypothetical protein
MKPAQAAKIKQGARKWIKHKRDLTKAANEAIAQSHQKRTAKAIDAAVEAIQQCCYAESSEKRLSVLLKLASAAPAEVFWRVFLDQ